MAQRFAYDHSSNTMYSSLYTLVDYAAERVGAGLLVRLVSDSSWAKLATIVLAIAAANYHFGLNFLIL